MLSAVPAELVTLILPVVAAAGTLARIWVLESTVKELAGVPLNATAVVPAKSVPVTCTKAPGEPLSGLMEVMLGSTATVKLVAL